MRILTAYSPFFARAGDLERLHQFVRAVCVCCGVGIGTSLQLPSDVDNAQMHCRLASHTAGGWQALLFASAALPQRHLRRYLGARACSSAPARHSTAKARADSLRFACQARKLLSAAAATAVPPPPQSPSQPPLLRTAVVAVTAASPQLPSLSHHHPHLRRRTPSRQGTAARCRPGACAELARFERAAARLWPPPSRRTIIIFARPRACHSQAYLTYFYVVRRLWGDWWRLQCVQARAPRACASNAPSHASLRLHLVSLGRFATLNYSPLPERACNGLYIPP
jgi:hypothetical protein